jgi:hypothetical protein
VDPVAASRSVSLLADLDPILDAPNPTVSLGDALHDLKQFDSRDSW